MAETKAGLETPAVPPKKEGTMFTKVYPASSKLGHKVDQSDIASPAKGMSYNGKGGGKKK